MAVESASDRATFFNVNEFALAASYTPPGGGAAVACAILFDQADQEIGFGDGRPVTSGKTVTVAADQVAAPARGGIFTITATGEALKVLDDPTTADPDRKIWICTVR
jgi:hypothetical protein